MTVRVTTLKGPDAGCYYVEALPSYYLDIDEPLGVWQGAGAAALGLGGEVDDAPFLSLMAGDRPGTDEALGRRYGEDSVRGFDITASAPKSVSVLFALGDAEVRHAVLAAHDTAVTAMVDWIERHAHTRYRIGGSVAVLDAEGIAAARFRQHTSRAMDPQLHTHVVIANRVQSPDGRWLALDARAIKVDQRTLSALYHASLRAELTRTLGVTWQAPVHGIAEMDSVSAELLAQFSSRTEAIAQRFEDKLERYAEVIGHAPSPRQRWLLEREAVTDSRPAKGHGLDAESLHQQWADQARAVGHDPARVVADAIEPEAKHRRLDARVQEAVVTGALASLSERQSTWRPAELVRELAAAVPTDVGVAPERLVPWLDTLAAEVIAEHLVDLSPPVPVGVTLRRDGRPITEAVTDRALTTPDILAEEERLIAWAEQRLEHGGVAGAAIGSEAATMLSEPQRELAAAVAGASELVMAIGPAGAGKTAALAPGIEALRAEGRVVFGVAPSATAAEVLATDTGVAADTLDKLLVEHALNRPPDHRYDLPAGATVIVDEAAMVSTPKLADLADLADRRAWRVVLVGDPLQFSAVGRSGMFGYLVSSAGAIELDRVHRFAHPWEAEASLRLRRGDASVLDVYDRHGRLEGGTRRQMEKAMLKAWSEARSQGQTAAMMAPTNDVVVALNQRAQTLRARDGELVLGGPKVAAGPYELHVGDLVATRHNERNLRTDRGLMVKNRDHWEVAEAHRGGALTVSGRTGRVRLPADYVRAHVELAYAETSHANQGRTVDRSLLLLDGPTDAAGIYVPMSRGRHSNDAFVVVTGEQSPVDVLAEAMARRWIDEPAVARRAELEEPSNRDPERGQVVTHEALAPHALRELLEREHAIGESLRRLDWNVKEPQQRIAHDEAARPRLGQAIRAAESRIEEARRRIEEYDRPFKRRHHQAELAAAPMIIGAAEAEIAKHRDELAKSHARAPGLERDLAAARAATADRPILENERRGIRDRLGGDLAVRATRQGRDAPAFVIEELGQRPARGKAAGIWDEAAARIDQHRSAFGITETRDVLGRPPRHGDGAYATSHRAAADATARLERVLGRDLAIQPLQRSLSLGR